MAAAAAVGGLDEDSNVVNVCHKLTSLFFTLVVQTPNTNTNSTETFGSTESSEI